MLDLPVSTAYSTAHTGLFGTVSTCAPSVPAPPTEMVVGVEGSCSYRGIASFDTASFLKDTPILSATLRLSTPGHTGTTDVLVYPNQPMASVASLEQPSNGSAPAIVLGAPGIAQSASEGSWQSWDVTALVRRWVQDNGTNGGITLVGAGAPVRFASPLGTADDDAASAPYLDITYGPRPTSIAPGVSNFAVTPNITLNDGSTVIYGASGTFDSCTPFNHLCGQKTAIQSVAAAQTAGFGGQFFRIQAALNCTRPLPSGWWDGPYSVIVAAINNPNRIIPVIDFVVPTVACASALTPLDWHEELQNFVTQMHTFSGMPASVPALYFEIGNEPELNGSAYPDFTNDFAQGAAGLYYNLNPTNAFMMFPFYRILTGGVTSPTADVSPSLCPTNWNRIDKATNAITAALNGSPPYGAVPGGALGTAVHPYRYRGMNPAVWVNYQGFGYPYLNVCTDLATMNTTWMSNTTLSGKVLMYSEINWIAQPTNNDPADRLIYNNADGSYLVDLFGYLHNHNFTQFPSTSPLRVMWYRGNDVAPSQLYAQGIYDTGGLEKTVNIGTCPDNAPVNGTHTISNDYYWLRNGECHNP